MSQIIKKQAQHIKAHDVIIYERDVFTVEGDDYTSDGLVKLTLRKAGQYFCKTVEVSVDLEIETLEL